MLNKIQKGKSYKEKMRNRKYQYNSIERDNENEQRKYDKQYKKEIKE